MDHTGHTIEPPRAALNRADLMTQIAGQPWQDVQVHDSVGSSNALLLQDPKPWRVIVADHQSQGRGRLDRTWEAPPCASIALSVSLPLPTSPTLWGLVPLLVGMAARTSVSEVTGVDLGLKWPNDLLARASGDEPWRKVAGILCQTASVGQPSTSTPPSVIAGIGLNVDLSAAELPVDTATSLALAGATDLSRERLVAQLLSELAQAQATWSDPGVDPESLRAAYESVCVTVGQQVDVHLPGGVLRRGAAVGIDEAGRLLVDGADGVVAHAVGDVVHVRGVA